MRRKFIEEASGVFMRRTAVMIRMGRQSSLKLPGEHNEKLRHQQHADCSKVAIADLPGGFGEVNHWSSESRANSMSRFPFYDDAVGIPVDSFDRSDRG